MKPTIIPETPEFSRSKRLSTQQSSAATQSLVHQSSSKTTIQDTPDTEATHRNYIEKKLKYSRRKDIAAIPSEETFVHQSQDVLSSTIVPSGSPIFSRKLKDPTPQSSNSPSICSTDSRQSEFNTNNKAQDPLTPTNQESRSHATNSGSSSRRKKGKPFKIVAWDKIESADPLATSVFRTNVSMAVDDKKSSNEIQKSATNEKVTATNSKNVTSIVIEDVEKQEKVEKKPKRRESVSRNRRLSTMNSESFVNYILAKEKTPSPATRLLKEKFAASFAAMDSSDDDDTPNKKEIESWRKQDEMIQPETGANRKSIFISGNVKSRTKHQLQGESGQKPGEEAKQPDKQSKSRKNLSKELGPVENEAVNSSLLALPLAVPIFHTGSEQSERKRGRKSIAVNAFNQASSTQTKLNKTNSGASVAELSKTNSGLSVASLNKTSSGVGGSMMGSSISVSGIEGLSFQNFSSESAKDAMTRLEREGWNSDIEKQLTGQKSKPTSQQNTTCDNNKTKPATNSRKSLKRKMSQEEPEKSGKKGKLDKQESNGAMNKDEICPTPKTTKPAFRIRNEQKTSFTPEPMELCDSPARRSGRKSTQTSTLATQGLLKSPGLLKQSKIANILLPKSSTKSSTTKSLITSQVSSLTDASQAGTSSTNNTTKAGPSGENIGGKPSGENVVGKSVIQGASNQQNDNDSEEELPATQAPPLFDNLVFFVEIMNGRYNISSYSEKRVQEYGGSIEKKLNRKVTHVLFHDGTRVNYLKAKKLGVPLLSAVYVDRCIQAGNLLPPAQFPSLNIEDYDKGKFPSIRKLKSMTFRSTEERMKLIDEKMKRKQRKEEKEKEKEEAKKKELKELQKSRPKPVYFPPLYYEGSPYMNKEKKEDKLSKLMEEIKSPTGSPINMDYFKAPSTPVWEDENEINLSLADRLLYRYKKNKALERGNSSAQDSPNQSLTETPLTETPPSNKIFESSSLDTTGKPRRLHSHEETTTESLDDSNISVTRGKNKSMNKSRQRGRRNTTMPIVQEDAIEPTQDATTTTAKQDKADEINEEDLSISRRRSGRASTKLATKVSAILAKQEASPIKNNAVSPTRKTSDAIIPKDAVKEIAKSTNYATKSGKEKSQKNITITNSNAHDDSRLKKKRGRKPKDVDAEICKANGEFGKPVLESTRLSIMDDSIQLNQTKSSKANNRNKSVDVMSATQNDDKAAINQASKHVKDHKKAPLSQVKDLQSSVMVENESPIISKNKSSRTNQSKVSISPNKSAAEEENDRLFDALVSGKKSPVPKSTQKKFVLSSTKTKKNNDKNQTLKKCSTSTISKATCPSPLHPSVSSPRASPRHTSSYPSPRASPRPHAATTTCPSPSASPRQESGSSPRHHQGSSPRLVSKSVDLLGGKQWGGGKTQGNGKSVLPVPSSGGGGTVIPEVRNSGSVLSPSAASIYQYSLARTQKSRIPSTAPVDQDAVQQAPDTSIRLQPGTSSRLQPDTSSSPESTTTPSPMKQKVMAPWRQHTRETPKAQNVSKDNVYDFDGDPDEFDVSLVVSTQSGSFQSNEGNHAGKLFRGSPTKPQGAFLLRSKLPVAPAGKMSLNSVMKSHQNPSSLSSSKSSVQEPSISKALTGGKSTLNSAQSHLHTDKEYEQNIQLSHKETKSQQSYESSRHSKPAYSHEIQHSSASASRDNGSTRGGGVYDYEFSEAGNTNNDAPNTIDYEADKPQRSAKKALLSRIFSKPPKDLDEQTSSNSGNKDLKDSLVPKETSENTQESNLRTSDNTSEMLRHHRKRKLYSQDILDETAKNSPTSAHKGITEAPMVENIHLSSSQTFLSKFSQASSSKSSASQSSKSSKAALAASEFKKPSAAPAVKRGKKKKRGEREEIGDAGNEREEEGEESSTHKTKSSQHKKGLKSRRSSAEFAPLPKFIRRMEEREASNSSDSSKSRRRGATKNIVCTSCNQEDISLVQQLVQSYGKYTVSTSVNSRTSHVISGEGKRTLNLLKGLLAGCWLVTKEWIVSSLEAGHWVDEEPYEMVDFSPAVRTLRIERETWREEFKSELFKEVGAIYISPNCRAPRDELKQLVHAGGGLVTGQARIAKVKVGDCSSSASSSHSDEDTQAEVFHVTEKWILDSVQFHMVLPFNDYPF